MSMLIYDEMPELTAEERPLYRGLAKDQQRAYVLVRDTTQCATERLNAARILPDEALVMIGNVVAMTVLRARR